VFDEPIASGFFDRTTRRVGSGKKSTHSLREWVENGSLGQDVAADCDLLEDLTAGRHFFENETVKPLLSP
jgi:hypothetical protein